MFGSLDEQIKRIEARSSSYRERWLRYSSIIVAALVLGGLYAAIMLLE